MVKCWFWIAPAALLAVGLGGCTPAQPGYEVLITVVAGPVCPVETTPPDPACAPRPVAAAGLTVARRGSVRVARATSDSAGRATLTLPNGHYRIEPQPVAGLMGTPAPVDFVVAGSGVALTLQYDTGIR